MADEIARMVVEAFQKEPDPGSAGSHLPGREAELLALLSEVLSNKEIAAWIEVSYDTIRAHRRHIYDKLHVRGRTEAVKQYLSPRGPAPESTAG